MKVKAVMNAASIPEAAKSSLRKGLSSPIGKALGLSVDATANSNNSSKESNWKQQLLESANEIHMNNNNDNNNKDMSMIRKNIKREDALTLARRTEAVMEQRRAAFKMVLGKSPSPIQLKKARHEGAESNRVSANLYSSDSNCSSDEEATAYNATENFNSTRNTNTLTSELLEQHLPKSSLFEDNGKEFEKITENLPLEFHIDVVPNVPELPVDSPARTVRGSSGSSGHNPFRQQQQNRTPPAKNKGVQHRQGVMMMSPGNGTIDKKKRMSNFEVRIHVLLPSPPLLVKHILTQR